MLLPTKEYEQKRQLESLSEQEIKESLERLLRINNLNKDIHKKGIYKGQINSLIHVVLNKSLYEDSLYGQRMRELLLVILEHQRRESSSINDLLGLKESGRPKTHSNVLFLIEHATNRYLDKMRIAESQLKIALKRNKSVSAIEKAIKRAKEEELETARGILRTIFFASDDPGLINLFDWVSTDEATHAENIINRILTRCDMSGEDYTNLTSLLTN